MNYKFRLKLRFEIEKVYVDELGNERYSGSGSERLTIDDSWDLGQAMTLTEVLKTIDSIHAIVRVDEVSTNQTPTQ